jgi:RNA polymerase sigma factor for flagellar operon FliA
MRLGTIAADSAAMKGIASDRAIEASDIAAYMPLVRCVVGSMMSHLPPHVLRDDVLAAGTLGLLDSLRRQKRSARGSAFGGYARVRIRGAILDELRAQDWLSRRTRLRFIAEGRGPAVIGIDDVPAAQHVMVNEAALTPEEQVCLMSEARGLANAVARLPLRERNIVNAHYFEGVQFRTIAHNLGVSEPRVSQLHSRAVARLREYLTEAA